MHKYTKSFKHAKGKYTKKTKYTKDFLITKYAKQARSTLSFFMNWCL
jgi:hypothetical protein